MPSPVYIVVQISSASSSFYHAVQLHRDASVAGREFGLLQAWVGWGAPLGADKGSHGARGSWVGIKGTVRSRRGWQEGPFCWPSLVVLWERVVGGRAWRIGSAQGQGQGWPGDWQAGCLGEWVSAGLGPRASLAAMGVEQI